MSSILKALKKLDAEAPGTENSVVWPVRVDTRRTIVGRVRQQWLLRRFTTIVVGLLLFALAGWGVMMRPAFLKRLSAPTNPETTVFVSPAPPAPAPANKMQSKAPTVTASPAGDVPSAAAPASAAAVPPVAEKPRDRSDAAAVASADSSLTSLPAAKTAPPPAEEPVPVTPEPVAPPPADASRFDLQALVWSDVPEERFAVINDRIIKEGQTIEGYLVTEIGWDTVILESEGGTWSLRHNQ